MKPRICTALEVLPMSLSKPLRDFLALLKRLEKEYVVKRTYASLFF